MRLTSPPTVHQAHSVSEYTAQSKGGMGKKGITTREEDAVVDVFTASTHDYILFFTDNRQGV